LVEGVCIVIFIPLTSVVVQKAGTVDFQIYFRPTPCAPIVVLGSGDSQHAQYTSWQQNALSSLPLVLVEGVCIVIFIPLTSVVVQKAGTVIFRSIFAPHHVHQ
jgi:uncharacterized membrane protein